MAISVDSTTNLNIIDSAEATTGWTFSGITKTATSSASREGTNCVGGQVALNTHGYAYHTHGSSINMTTAGNERVYIWAKCGGAGTVAQDGWKVVIGDGTNRRAYTVGGSDAEPFGAKGWYCLMLDTANLPTPYTGFGSGTPSLTAITEFGFGVYNTVAPSGNALNVFVDVVRYGSGLVVTSGATDDISLADIASDDFSSATGKAYGIIREIQPGVYGVQGDILFGDTAGNSIDWKETEAVVIFEDRVKGAGTNTVFKMSGQHSATGTFRTELGIAISSGDTESGRSGVAFVSANPASQPVDFDFSDTDIEDVFLYGCSFTNMRGGTIAFSADATNGISHHISGCTFSGCAQVDPGRTVFRNTLFASTSSTTGAALWNENINIKNCSFLGNTTGEGIEHDAIISVHAFTAGAGGSNTVCIGTGFTANVAVNDYAYNETDGSYAKVTSVDSNTQFTTDGLAGGTDNTFSNLDEISVSPAVTYDNLTFSGNTSDVTNSATGSDALFISKTGTSDPSTSTGTVVFIGAVTLTFEAVDKTDTAISGVQVSAYLISDNSQVILDDTNGSGLATATFTGSTPNDIYYRYRKSSTGATKYINLSGFGTIESSTGLTIKRSMTEDTIADPSI